MKSIANFEGARINRGRYIIADIKQSEAIERNIMNHFILSFASRAKFVTFFILFIFWLPQF